MAKVCLDCLAFHLRHNSIIIRNRSIQSHAALSAIATTSEIAKGPWLGTIGGFHTSAALARGVKQIRMPRDLVNRQTEKQIRYSRDYIDEKIEEYDLSVRRLATIMGHDPKTFTEADVKKSIHYLFPSSIYTLRARPSIEHPAELFPQEIVLDAYDSGRPKHFLFYTLKDPFYTCLHEIYDKLLKAQKIDDVRTAKGLGPEKVLNLDRSSWITQDQLEKRFEKMTGKLHESLIAQLERLAEEPYAYMFEDLIMSYRVEHVSKTMAEIGLPEIQKGKKGVEYVVCQGHRKTAVATVKLLTKGSGKIQVNGETFDDFFPLIRDREIVISPFNLFGLNRHFDVEARVAGGLQGEWERADSPQNWTTPKGAMAGAVRLGICRGLQCFLEPEQREEMRRAGLLTRDPRVKERKKPGQWKARKKFTWKKR